MSSSCVEEVGIERNHWYRIVQELLQKPILKLTVRGPGIFRLNTPIFSNAFCRKDRWAWARVIWMAGGNASGWICFFIGR